MAAVERTPLSESLLTVDEVAAPLRVPRSTVYELTRTRRLPHIKVGAGRSSSAPTSTHGVVANRITPRQ